MPDLTLATTVRAVIRRTELLASDPLQDASKTASKAKAKELSALLARGVAFHV